MGDIRWDVALGRGRDSMAWRGEVWCAVALGVVVECLRQFVYMSVGERSRIVSGKHVDIVHTKNCTGI